MSDRGNPTIPCKGTLHTLHTAHTRDTFAKAYGMGGGGISKRERIGVPWPDEPGRVCFGGDAWVTESSRRPKWCAKVSTPRDFTATCDWDPFGLHCRVDTGDGALARSLLLGLVRHGRQGLGLQLLVGDVIPRGGPQARLLGVRIGVGFRRLSNRTEQGRGHRGKLSEQEK